MTAPSTASRDQRMERMIAVVLRTGLFAAAAVVLLGAIIYVARHGGERPDYRLFRGEPADLRSVAGIVELARERRSSGMIQLGVLILLATPIARVILSLIVFALERDRLYVMVTVAVLGMLLYSVIGGYR